MDPVKEEKKEEIVVKDPSAEVDKLLGEEPIVEPTAPEPAKPATPAEEPHKDGAAPATTTDPAPVKPVDDAAKPAEPAPEKKYAGKYTNTLDLIEGVLEEIKVLKGDKKEISSLVAEAQTSGDWSKVEAKYKELQSQVVKQIQDSKKTEVKPTDKPSEEKPVETELKPEEFEQLVLETTMKQINDSDLAKKFAKHKAVIPTTQEELDELEIAFPTLFIQFEQTFRNLYTANKKQAEAFLAAEKEAPGYNETQKQTTKQQIEEFIKEWNVTVSPEEIDSMIAEAEKDESIYEHRNGVKFIRENAIFDRFMVKNARTILAKVKAQTKVEGLNEGKVEAIKHIEDVQKKSPSTLSTAAAPASAVITKPAEIDWTNPEEAKKAGRQKIQERIESALFE